MPSDTQAASLNSDIELSTLLEGQILQLLSAARAERQAALAVLRAAIAHVEQLRQGDRVSG